MKIQEKDIIKILEKIIDPVTGKGMVARDMISGLQIMDKQIVFLIEIDPAHGTLMETLRQKAESAVAKKAKGYDVRAILTAQKKPDSDKLKSTNPASDPHGMNKNPRLDLPIKSIIAVASGKGGVGKSTIAFNLAYAFARQGKSVGLLDADIYGPSVPTLSGLPLEKPRFDENQKIIPHEAYGLKVMSIGFLSDQDAPMIWRGPMVQTAIYQLLRDVAWGCEDNPLDILVIDMPPGTGDAQLTLAQKVPVTGAVIVSTPQDLALIDAKKAVAMFRKTNVPVLGLIENMSTYVCPSCGHEDHIFGHGGARAEAQRANIPFLGALPLQSEIRMLADSGKPAAEDMFSAIASLLSVEN